MIMGIISLIIFIVGFFLLFYGNDDNDLLWFSLGMVLSFIGFCGIIAFIGINLDVIKSWFTI